MLIYIKLMINWHLNIQFYDINFKLWKILKWESFIKCICKLSLTRQSIPWSYPSYNLQKYGFGDFKINNSGLRYLFGQTFLTWIYFIEKDLYALLEIEPDADEKTIKKAYRKKALTCHPDKNPDNEVYI